MVLRHLREPPSRRPRTYLSRSGRSTRSKIHLLPPLRALRHLREPPNADPEPSSPAKYAKKVHPRCPVTLLTSPRTQAFKSHTAKGATQAIPRPAGSHKSACRNRSAIRCSSALLVALASVPRHLQCDPKTPAKFVMLSSLSISHLMNESRGALPFRIAFARVMRLSHIQNKR